MRCFVPILLRFGDAFCGGIDGLFVVEPVVGDVVVQVTEDARLSGEFFLGGIGTLVESFPRAVCAAVDASFGVAPFPVNVFPLSPLNASSVFFFASLVKLSLSSAA